MVTAEMYDAVNAKINIDQSPPEGLLMHSAGDLNGTWQIVDVWESEEHARRFDTERLAPAIREVTGMENPPGSPQVTVYELHHLVRP
jgi:hypothetical protein